MSNTLDANDLGADIESLLRGFLHSITTDVNRKYYVGKVEDNKDPDEEGKCKVRIYSIFGTEVPTSDLPWAVMDTAFVGSSVGGFIVPEVGTLVSVYLDDENIYAPHYGTKVMNKNKLPSQRKEDYPNTMVLFETDNGDYLTLNRKTMDMYFRHASGLMVKIDKDGNTTMDNSNPKTGNITIISKKKVQIQASEVEIANDMGTSVVPNAGLGGAFCSLPNCVYSGAPHQGKLAKNCLTKHSDI